MKLLKMRASWACGICAAFVALSACYDTGRKVTTESQQKPAAKNVIKLSKPPNSIAWDPTSEKCAVVSDNRVVIWPSHSVFILPDVFRNSTWTDGFAGFKEPFWQVVWRPDGEMLIVLAGGVAVSVDIAAGTSEKLPHNVCAVWWEGEQIFTAPAFNKHSQRRIHSWKGAEGSKAIRALPRNAVVAASDAEGRGFLLYGETRPLPGMAATERTPEVIRLTSDLSAIAYRTKTDPVASGDEYDDQPLADRIVADDSSASVAFLLCIDNRNNIDAFHKPFLVDDRGAVHALDHVPHEYTWAESTPAFSGDTVVLTTGPWPPLEGETKKHYAIYFDRRTGAILKEIDRHDLHMAAISPNGERLAIATRSEVIFEGAF